MGTNQSKPSTGRGRGRPRKTHVDVEKNIKRVKMDSDIDDAMSGRGHMEDIFSGGNWDQGPIDSQIKKLTQTI